MGANKELQRDSKSWYEDEGVKYALLMRRIEWVFNPPAVPHIGRVWERQICTVKNVLSKVIGTQILENNRLLTVFCNLEEIVNGRPLTLNPNDPSDLEPLTPLHLLRTESITVDTGKDPHISETYR